MKNFSDWQMLWLTVISITIINIPIKFIFGHSWHYVFSALYAGIALTLLTFLFSLGILIYARWKK